MKNHLYLGVDVGTTSIKAAAYDMSGHVVAKEAVDSPIKRGRANWSTQSMDEVWDRCCKAIRSVVAQIEESIVVSIGVCGQGDGLWALDAANRPVCDAILWNDQRAESFVLDWAKDGTTEKLSRYCRTENWPGTAGAAFAWLTAHEPEHAARVSKVLFCKDWINYNLTGNIATDFSDASIPFLDLEKRQYAIESFALLGVEALVGKLPDPQPANALHGRLRLDAAQTLGLIPGIPVSVGCIDLGAMMASRGLNKTGDICLILGTTAVLNVVVDPQPFVKQPVGATLIHPFLDKWIRVLGPSSGASAMDWFLSVHAGSFVGGTVAEKVALINEMAMNVPPGSNGVVFLPFLAGERAPFVSPHATASFVGLKTSTTIADMARAVMEGVAFSLKHCFVSTGVKNTEQTFLTGGGALNPFWCDIVANVIGTRVVASDASDHGLWGAALIGASAAGLVDLSKPPVRTENTRIHEPDPTMVETYRTLFETYQECVSLSSDIWNIKNQLRRT